MIQKAVKIDSRQASSILHNEPWSDSRSVYYHTAIEGYLQGLSSTISDWKTVRSELIKLSPKIDPFNHPADTLTKIEQHRVHTIDRLITQQWASHDLHEALDWYLEKHDGVEMVNTSWIIDNQLLFSLPQEKRSQLINWMESRQVNESWDDSVIVSYAENLRLQKIDSDIMRLSALPRSEKDRVAIVSAFVTPIKKDEKLTLQHPPEVLQELVSAAGLSESESAKWRSLIENSIWLPEKG